MGVKVVEQIQELWDKFQFSLPVQLITLQIRNHKLLLLLWLILLGIITGAIGKDMGGAYLFLEPEYLGKENFWSVFIVGSALGAFLFAYMITVYIYASYRYHFIALTPHPFTTLSYNNFIIPIFFLSIYIWRFVEFHALTDEGISVTILEKTGGLILGVSTVFIIFATFFFAERTIFHQVGEQLQAQLEDKQASRRSWIILGKARKTIRSREMVEHYLGFPLKFRKVESLPPVNLRNLVRTLNQHHGKLLLVQIMFFLIIAVLSFLEHKRYFQIPAGASFLLILSLVMMILGALSFWLHKVGPVFVVISAAFVLMIHQSKILREDNHAFGLLYQGEPTEYSQDMLNSTISADNVTEDREQTLQMLDLWKENRSIEQSYSQPKAVFVTASGGGLRSAYWTLTVLQNLDSLTQGEIRSDIRLMSGASGGMFGLAYYRELLLRTQVGENIDFQSEAYGQNISRDLLNRIFFKKFADMLLPSRQVMINGQKYDRGVGFSFDHQLVSNLPEFEGRKLGDYALWEKSGKLPLMVMTPTIVNQGRKLYISASPISYLVKEKPVTERYFSRSKGVEFRRFFEEKQPDSLLMSTALRLNATFPYVLPVVELPSEPVMAVMDAGAIDNFGTQVAMKFLHEFKDWFAQNTESVLLIQIRDTGREAAISDPSQNNYLQEMLAPLGDGYSSLIESKDLSNDYLVEFIRDWYPGPLEIVTFEYPHETSQHPASLSWHLTEREKRSIMESIHTEDNQQAFKIIESLYREGLLAENNKAELLSR